MHEIATHLDAGRWLRYEHRAVNYDKAKAPAYVVDGGLPSECSHCSTLVWLGPTPKPVTMQAGNAWLRCQSCIMTSKRPQD